MFALAAVLAFLDAIDVKIKMWWAKEWAASSTGCSSDLPGSQQQKGLQSLMPTPCDLPKSTEKEWKKLKLGCRFPSRSIFTCIFFIWCNEIHCNWTKATYLFRPCSLSVQGKKTSQFWLNFKLHRGKNSGSYFVCVSRYGQLSCILIFILIIGQYWITLNQ